MYARKLKQPLHLKYTGCLILNFIFLFIGGIYLIPVPAIYIYCNSKLRIFIFHTLFIIPQLII